MIRVAWVTAYVACIVAANVATNVFGVVPVGFGLAVTAGTAFAGLALVLRDGVQLSDGPFWALGAIVVGAALSYVMASPAIAVASGIAFLASELVDMAVFTPLARRTLPGAVIVSSLVAAPVDTVLFLHIAGFPVTPATVAAQVIVKTLLALAAAAFIVWRRK